MPAGRPLSRDPRRMTEMDVHMYIVGLLNNCLAPSVVWWHTPNGELRDKDTAIKLKRMGVLPGVFDFTILIPGAYPCFLEAKGDDGRLSEEQKEFAKRVVPLACKVGVAKNPEEARKLLIEWGAVLTSKGLF